jgi:hypothetical protein
MFLLLKCRIGHLLLYLAIILVFDGLFVEFCCQHDLGDLYLSEGLKMLYVVPPNGTCFRGPAESQIVIATWLDGGKSLYLIGNANHSFHLPFSKERELDIRS